MRANANVFSVLPCVRFFFHCNPKYASFALILKRTITKQQARDRYHESTTTTADGRARVRATRRRLTARLFTRRLQTREDFIEASTDGDTTVVFSASENETENGDASDAHQQTNERFDGRRVSS